MADLEEILRQRQDQLRGRHEDWIDRFGDWRRSVDWYFWTCVFSYTALVASITVMVVRHFSQ